MTEFDVTHLLRDARDNTGLDDFGVDEFRPGLEALVAGIKNDPDLLDGRKPVLHHELVRILCNRLRWRTDLASHPEISHEQILPPVVINSLPRTGTTKLQRLLGETDAFQNLILWHSHMPSRIPEMENDGIEHRMEETRKFYEWRVQVVPEIQTSHPMTYDEPEEDVWLTEGSFRSHGLIAVHNAPEYANWLLAQDILPTYEFLYAQLQYLQWQFYPAAKKPWLLKSPVHMGQEEMLTKVFSTDTKFICIHREPAQIFPSLCLVNECFRRVFYKMDENDEELGKTVGRFTYGLEQHIAWRDANSEVDILDLSFKELTSDSLATAEKVYDFLDLPLTSAIRKAIEDWDKNNPRYKHGKNSYSLEKYGLTEVMVNDSYRHYRERFSSYL